MRRSILPLILGGALSIAAIVPAAAAPPTNRGGAAGVIAAVVQVAVNVEDSLNNNEVRVITLENSLNNALQNAFQNANINVLNNAVQNILNNNDVDVTVTDITVIGDDLIITVLGTGISL
ncbi:MAG: hypothetical protein M3545_15740 [Acidobacteriota bacterium]|nr:hypothetical protein [Acidobacteriota bacterium]